MSRVLQAVEPSPEAVMSVISQCEGSRLAKAPGGVGCWGLTVDILMSDSHSSDIRGGLVEVNCRALTLIPHSSKHQLVVLQLWRCPSMPPVASWYLLYTLDAVLDDTTKLEHL